MSILDQHSGAIKELCDHHKVKALYAFGSVLTGNFSKDSDVDLVVDFDPIPVAEYADNYYDLKFSLQDIFKRSVDLLEERALKNPYFKEAIHRKRRLIYGR